MRGSKAKRLRRAIYGDRVTSRAGRRYARLLNGQVVADPLRRAYQKAKRRRAGKVI